MHWYMMVLKRAGGRPGGGGAGLGFGFLYLRFGCRFCCWFLVSQRRLGRGCSDVCRFRIVHGRVYSTHIFRHQVPRSLHKPKNKTQRHDALHHVVYINGPLRKQKTISRWTLHGLSHTITAQHEGGAIAELPSRLRTMWHSECTVLFLDRYAHSSSPVCRQGIPLVLT